MLTSSRTLFFSFVILVGLIAISSRTANGQSRSLYIPVLTGDSADSVLTLMNASLEPATVTLTARSYGGAVLNGYGIINPVTITLPASSSRALKAKELFGQGLIAGWAELQSASPSISGAFFLLDSNQNAFDGAAINTAPASRLIFPKATTDPLAANRLVLINTASRATGSMKISAFENSGRLVAQRNMSLAAFSGFSGGITDLLPNLRAFDGSVIVEANSASSQGSLIGFETYRDGSDIAALGAMPHAARLQAGYLPQFGSQAGTVSTIVLLNSGGGLQTISVTAAITDLTGGGLVSKTVAQTLAANERFEGELHQLFGFDPGKFITSYVRFQAPANSAGVFGYLASKTVGGGAAAVEAQESGYSDVSFSHIANGAGSFTGLTLMNAGLQASSVTVDAFDSQGSPADTATLTLAPNTGWSGLLSQLLPGTDAQTGGRVHITASARILATEIWGSTSTGALAVVPAQGSALTIQASGQPVSARKGGIVTSADGSVSLAIPPGALRQDSPVRITPLNAAGFSQPSQNEHLVGVVEGTPDGTHFRIPVRLRFSLTETVQSGSPINLLILNPSTHQYDPSEFVAAVDPSGRTASADVTHFTVFAATVTNVKISSLRPNKGPVGTIVTISGSGFSPTASDDFVRFNKVDGGTLVVPALTASSTVLTVSVPSGAATGNVRVKVGSATSNGVKFTVTSPVNNAPVITAIPNQTVTLPSGVVLSGTISDDGLPNGNLTASWRVVSGPGIVTFGTATAKTSGATGQSLTLTASAAVSFSAAGTYDIRLTANDGKLTSSDDAIITVNAPGNAPAVTNQPPVVNAGANQTITLPAYANLTGSATDDGLPNGALTARWSVISGPGTVTFGNATSSTTTVTFSASGGYTLQLTASDGQLSSSSTTTVTVNAATGPVVSAGANRTITLPSSAALSGSVTDPCLPNCALTGTWNMASGPGTVTFANPGALSTTATFSTAGTYVLQLTASDGLLSSSSTITVAVNACGTAVSGTVTLTANVTSSVGIAGVQFQLDGVNLGPQLTTSPYSFTWLTTTAGNGCHVITAAAQDVNGNTGTTAMNVTVNNP